LAGFYTCCWASPADEFGLSWQIVPKVLSELVGDPDSERAQRAMKAMLQMKKIDIKEIRRAHDGRSTA
jgi:predicted 3-demethylubiquinone-9 3-methyltransferase (glyoxalase superfamily)